MKHLLSCQCVFRHSSCCTSAAGLIRRATEAGQHAASSSDLAAEMLQELLETPVTGQAVFRIAALQLNSAMAALPKAAR